LVNPFGWGDTATDRISIAGFQALPYRRAPTTRNRQQTCRNAADIRQTACAREFTGEEAAASQSGMFETIERARLLQIGKRTIEC